MKNKTNVYVEGRKERNVTIREYECIICNKRTHIIYSGRCYTCERDERKRIADKQFK